MGRGILVVGPETFQRAVSDALADRRETLLWTAEDAQQALALLDAHAAELDALLLALPADQAAALLAGKAKKAQWDALPTLAFTSSVEETARVLEAGASSACELPVDARTLGARLAGLLRLRRAAGLSRASQRDALTGLHSRHAFYSAVERRLREQPQESWSIVAFDVDHFKIINELFGYETGDSVLKAIARTLEGGAGARGVAARLESDRFVLCAIQPDVAALTASLNAVIKPLLGGLRATLYAGMYSGVQAGEDVGVMCDRALMALKTVKGSFLKQWAAYDAKMRETMLREQALMADMNGALEREEFIIYLQPLFSITSGDPISAEALVRWQHPTRGLLSPGLFVPLFERNGFVTRLDAYVWEKACQYLHDAMQRGQPVLPISVNVSRLNLYRPNLCQEIVSLVERYQVPPRLLKLEITESAYTDNPHQLLEAMKELHAHGFEILMDDFGSGYSSLNMLKEVPVDTLKIDMRFLDDFENNGRAGNVMTSIIRMAKWLQIVVVAEGVETQAQIDFLRSIGCDRVQGFYFSKPLPTSEFEQLLRDQANGLAPRHQENEQLLTTRDFDSVWETSQRTDMLFGGMLGAIGLYERAGDVLEVVRVNDGYYQLMGCTPASLFSDDKNVLVHMEPGDRSALLAACDRAVTSAGVEELQLRRRCEDGRTRWLSVRVRYLGRVGTRQLFYMAANDISRLKTLERGFLLSQYGSAMLDAYFSITELVYEHNRATVILLTSGEERFHTRTMRLDYAMKFHLRHCVHPDDRQLYAELYDPDNLRRLFAEPGRSSATLEVRMRRIGGLYKWVRLTLYPLHDDGAEDGLRLISCCRIIDGQKQAEIMREENRVLREKQRAQELYRTVVEQMGTALMEWSLTEQKAVYSERFLKYALSECAVPDLCDGRMPDDVVCQQDESHLRSFFHQWLHLQGRAETTVRLRRKDGAYPWCTLRASLIRDASGAPERIILTLNDVDAERKTQLLLSAQQSENDRRLAMLTNLYWTLPCGIWQLSAGQRSYTLFNNRACWELFGFTHKQTFEAAVAGNPADLIHPDDRGRFSAALEECKTTGQSQELDLRILRVGSEGSVRGSITREMQSDGTPMMQFVFMDTTLLMQQERHLKETQAALQNAMSALQHLMDNLPVGVALLEMNDPPSVQFLNDRASQMFRLEKGDAEGLTALAPLSGERYARAAIEKRLAAQQDDHYVADELSHAHRQDGDPFWLRAYTAFAGQQDAPPLCYAVFADVTRQVEVERAYNRQSELYRIVMEESQVLFFDYDVEGDVMNYSLRMPDGKRVTRAVPDCLRALKHSVILHPDHIDSFIRAMRRHTRSLKPGVHEFLADFYGTGEFRWFRAFFHSVDDENSSIYRMVGRVDDVNDEKRAEEQLRSAKVFRSALDSVSLFMFELDLPQGDLRLTENSKEVNDYYPYLDYLDARSNSSLLHPDDRSQVTDGLEPERLMEKYRTGVRKTTLQFRALSRTGVWKWLEMVLHLTRGAKTGSVRGVGYVKEIDRQKELEERAQFDAVTGLYNRATTEERISGMLDSEHAGCLMIFDLDDFKSVNDSRGHELGDQLLRGVGDTLRANLRASDVVGRLGGDEFVAFLQGVQGEQAVRDKCAELLTGVRALSERFQLPTSISIGGAFCPQNGADFSTLYRAADKALYCAKENGKNQVAFYQGDGAEKE